jgi:hypothetical protein
MAALAHSLDEEPLDPAEAPMSEADFRIIERAHAICDHAPARELTAEPHDKFSRRLENWNLDEQRAEQALIPHAVKILRAQIRAGELLREMAQKGERAVRKNMKSQPATSKLSDLGVSKTCLVELGDDETDEVKPVTDWKRVAQDAWHSEGWAQAAQEYRTKRGKQRGVRQ